jgi:ribosomal protein S18 acetylase RimI-like enzyme
MGSNGGRRPSRPEAAPIVRVGRGSDAPVAASLHAGQIAGGFLSFLGVGFLTRLYRRISLSPDSFLLVAEAEGRVVGFVAGSGDVGGLYRSFLWHDGAAAALSVAGRLLRRWRLAVETLRHGSADGGGKGEGVELLAIAVEPGHQGAGVGGALVGSFLDRVGQGPGRVAYVVVASDNAGAIGLYRRAGFAVDQEFELHSGASSLLMQWRRPEPAAGTGDRA